MSESPDDLKRLLTNRFRRLLRQGIAAPLEAAGFHRKGQKLFKELGPLSYLVEVERRSDLVESGILVRFQAWLRITGAWFVLSPDKEELRTYQSGIAKIPEVEAAQLAEIRIKCDGEFRCLHPSDTEDELERKIDTYRRVIEEGLLPWLFQFETPEDVGDYMIDPAYGPGRTRIGYRDPPQSHTDLASAAACFCVAGNAQKARQAVTLMKRMDKVPQLYRATYDAQIRNVERWIVRLERKGSAEGNA